MILWGKSYSVTILNETSSAVLWHDTADGLFSKCLVLTFTAFYVDKILWCYHLNETSSAVLSHGTICFFSMSVSSKKKNRLVLSFGTLGGRDDAMFNSFCRTWTYKNRHVSKRKIKKEIISINYWRSKVIQVSNKLSLERIIPILTFFSIK